MILEKNGSKKSATITGYLLFQLGQRKIKSSATIHLSETERAAIDAQGEVDIPCPETLQVVTVPTGSAYPLHVQPKRYLIEGVLPGKRIRFLFHYNQ